MTIIDPLTVVNSTSCYSVDSVDSCSFIETPGVFEISKDPAIFFEHESPESYECMSLETPPVFEISRMTIIDPLTNGK